MEFEDWEYISEDTLFTSQTINEEDPSNEEDGYQIETAEKGHGYEVPREIKEVTEVELQSLEGTEEEVQFEYEFEEESLLETESWGSVEDKEINDGNGLNGSKWRWRMRGIGAVKSVGIAAAAAAATLSMYILGGCKRNQTRKPQVQIHGDVKRNKEVMKNETKLDQTFSDLGGTLTASSYMYLDGYFPAF